MSNGEDVQYGILRIGIDPNDWDKGHNVNLYKYNGGWYVSDVGRMANHGMKWDKLLNKEIWRFRYFQYLNKN